MSPLYRKALVLAAAALPLAAWPVESIAAQANSVTCGHGSNAYYRCPTGGYATGVRLARDLSGKCNEGTSWGYTDAFIWTKQGCEGRFEVTYGSGPVAPVDPGFGVGNERTIVCGTVSGAQVQCRTGGYATGVRLVRDLNQNRCRQGSNWGYTDSFIWANNGCRAEFVVTYRSAAVPPPGLTKRITCGTTSGAQVECKTHGYATAVRLIRDLSGNRCRQGSNWGHTDSFIWANRGCRAEFEVTYRANTPAPAPATRIISCGKNNGAAMSCNAFGTVATVRLLRDLSRGRCRQQSSWGHGRDDLWVKRGCHGEFEVSYAMVAQPR